MAADKSELRQLAPNHLLQALDAIKVHGAFAHPCLSDSTGVNP